MSCRTYVNTRQVGGPASLNTSCGTLRLIQIHISNRVQLTSDGHKPYLQAVEDAFGADIDYASWG
jgi:hypothetical protein